MKILKPFNDRINSPLYSTFLIAWCITNWKIFFVTFFVTQRELGMPKFDYVQDQLHVSNILFTLLIPSFVTYLYIYQLPRLEKIVSTKFYAARAERKETKVNAMEKSPVTGEDYRNLLLKYVSREESLNVFMEKERAWLEDKETLLSDVKKTNEQNSLMASDILTVNATLNTYRNNKNIHQFFKGRWLLKYQQHGKNNYGEEYFLIDQTSKYIIEGQKEQNPFLIRYFHHDSLNTDSLYFLKIKEMTGEPEIRFVQVYKVDDYVYEGTEYGIQVNKSKQYTNLDGTKYNRFEFVTFDVTYRKPILKSEMSSHEVGDV